MSTFICEDTPENWKRFRAKLKKLNSPHRHMSNPLDAQIAKENKALRKLRCFLPGHEPDRDFR